MQAFIVLKNGDFTEGRGPMLFHSVWTDGDEAIKWVAKQSGIFGSPQEVVKGKYGHYAYANGYQIEETTLVASASELDAANIAQERAAAIAKLSPRERQLLNLPPK